MKQIIDYVKAHWVFFVGLLFAIWNYAKPTVEDFIHNHPHFTFWYGMAVIIVMYYLKSPPIYALVQPLFALLQKKDDKNPPQSKN